MTQLESAREGIVTDAARRVAQRENVLPTFVRDQVAAGKLVVPANVNHLRRCGRLDPTGIGRAIRTKINANLGASPVSSSREEELAKLQWAVKYGADTAMDLSTGGDLNACREYLIANATIPIGTVPIYEMIVGRNVEELSPKIILDTIERQAKQGVDFFTIHAGVLKEHLSLVRNRIAGIVSRGGALLARWMMHHEKQNPLYELFDEISAIMREYDVTYSLGDGLRPGALADATDEAQLAELRILGALVQRAREAGVQVMVEGPGHIPFDQIEHNMKIQQQTCHGAPFYVLGPIVTDVFPGYDHITSAIGATAAAYHGAAFLCYVTPREHLGLPKREDVKQGCIAYKIAAHAADVARGLPGARDWDDELSRARAALNWEKHLELAFDGETARALRDEDLALDTDYCTMCGHDWCSVRISKGIRDFASGSHPDFQPRQATTTPPEPSPEAIEPLTSRRGRNACHSDVEPDPKKAKQLQREQLIGSKAPKG